MQGERQIWVVRAGTDEKFSQEYEPGKCSRHRLSRHETNGTTVDALASMT
jgi:hypothetical protein